MTTVRSYSKINLGLHIGPPRPDGYHHLATIYQTIELHDLVTVTATVSGETSITLRCQHPGVPCDERNTAYKAVAMALDALETKAAVEIAIDKRLPVQGGIGAGSANAAAAILALEAELGRQLTANARLALAGGVGSDVPMFLIGGTMLGIERGEETFPLPDLPSFHIVTAFPEVGVSTPQAFRDWDATLTQNAENDRLIEFRRRVAMAFAGQPGVSGKAGDLAEEPLLALVRTGLENDFETVVFPQQPSLRALKSALEEGSLYSALSGSGSSLFGLYCTEEAAQAAQQRVRSLGCEARQTRTLPRSEYWATMFI
ncbi:4-(cytidine 5'-diphospho)-2-C-methyl-D-erythritol kinase [Terriglobus albidus]|uniref:4-diphosphocytidyl-2-C-methyl-D-erythritol kinase n=1 Tax=Terriglobus albidus TaxID=1592106 RepID=A0A5B9E8N9_9BACT|nr:4-(cytidine 5'-diphospho)-2-C-methyl-D-erythritol kinase [Terriglobus albidus]QEE27485.1 4-(cytidine 5'-diphospho)-2-C-methyl-D-erythritol kinase [Terriglobus albidus]